MKNIIDKKRVARGARIGKIATFGGLGILLVGMILSLLVKDMSVIWISFGCLIVGLVVSSIGTLNMNRWVRQPRADQALAQGLKGFDDRYRLYSYVLPAPHILLGPMGLTVLTAMGQDGTIRYDGTRFRRAWTPGRLLRLMADEGLGRPLEQVQREITAVQEFLASHEAGQGIDIEGIIVFYNPRVQLDIADPPLPIVEPKGIKKAIRKQSEKLSNRQYKELQALFDEAAGEAEEGTAG